MAKRSNQPAEEPEPGPAGQSREQPTPQRPSRMDRVNQRRYGEPPRPG
jgi:hypothetical protein